MEAIGGREIRCNRLITNWLLEIGFVWYFFSW